MAKRIVTHSNYTVKKKHQRITGGTVYERDYMTINSMDSYVPGEIPVYGSNLFKMTVRNVLNGKLKYKYGNWEKNNCLEDPEIWTLDCLKEGEMSDDNKIELKPNYTSLLNFAYWGSAVELVKASISDIIGKYPAELYLSDKKLQYYKNGSTILNDFDIDGATAYIVENPFLLDLTTKSIAGKTDVENMLRYFCDSAKEYSIINDNGQIESDNLDWDVDYIIKECYNDGDLLATVTLGDIKIFQYFINGYKILLYTDENKQGYHIRPNENVLNTFFDSIDDFQKILLNRVSKPLYTAILDTPFEDETGVYETREKYTWPISHGWNLDIESGNYMDYVNRLLSNAEFYDEYYSDNLWRSMTHDAIKNMDLTYSKLNGNETHEDYELGTSRIQQLIRVYGRQFDDLKRYVDNIKLTNNITYDGKNNLPDYFLTDNLNLSGWEVMNINPDEEAVKKLYEGQNEEIEYNSDDANIEFLKRLKMNSKYILSHKGTTRGLKLLLNLFGLTEDNYEINEKIIKVNLLVISKQEKEKIKYFKNAVYNESDNSYDVDWTEDINEAKKYNTKTDSLADINTFNLEGAQIDIDTSLMDIVKKINPLKKNFVYESDESNILTDELQGLPLREYENEDGERWIVPWFDKNKKLDGDPYFQMYGGWGKRENKEVFNPINDDAVFMIENDNIYDETKKYLNVVETLHDLREVSLQKLNNNDVYYVNDTTDFNEVYQSIPSEKTPTHYFIIKDINNSYTIGVDKDNKEGWVCVFEDEFNEDSLSENAQKILYLESLIDTNIGNNPHVGYGKYDEGKSYCELFTDLFKYSRDNDNFTDDAYLCDNGGYIDGINESGFNFSEIETDNTKIEYYGEIQKHDDADENEEHIIEDPDYVINVKNLEIIFKDTDTKWENFIKTKILPYLKQLIPSSTIWVVKFR